MSDTDRECAEESTVTSSQDGLEKCYVAIQNGDFDLAYSYFVIAVDKNDDTLGGLIFETIINGLIIFGYIKSFSVTNYGISSKSMKQLKSIPKSAVVCIFEAIYNIAHNKEKFSNHSIAECFKMEKQRREQI